MRYIRRSVRDDSSLRAKLAQVIFESIEDEFGDELETMNPNRIRKYIEDDIVYDEESFVSGIIDKVLALIRNNYR